MKLKFKRLNQVTLALFVLLAVRLFYLQVLRGVRYARLSDRNRIRRFVLPAPRGRIFDRNGVLLADTRPSWTVAVIPTETNDSAIELLGRILSQPAEQLRRRLEPIAALPAPVNILRDVPLKTIVRIEENNSRLPGVIVRVDPVRNYPFKGLYAHTIGYLGEISEEELARDTSYRRLDYIGKTGIEASYENFLRGKDGQQFVEVDVRGREIGPLLEKRAEPATPGKDIYLTIDHRLQNLAYELTEDYERAAVIGISIRTGEVLCLVSRPAFDPNIFLSPLNAARWDSLVSNPSKPFYNRAISSAYPPGSTFKPLIALLALEQRLVTPQTTLLPCTGRFRFGNREFKCWTAHGRLNLLEAIEQSCNTYFYQLGIRLKLDTLISFCRRFGLGEVTGIDIPGENPGTLPARELLDRRYGRGKWTQGVMLNFAIGQGEILLTPLQLALTYCCIANNGSYYQPHLIARVDSAGRTVFVPQKKKVEVKLDHQALSAVKNGLNRVVEYGTGRAAQQEEFAIAGKTGTAQNPPKPDHAWFVGYAPAENPEVVFAVIVENAGHGGAIAAPIVGELVRTYWQNSRLR